MTLALLNNTGVSPEMARQGLVWGQIRAISLSGQGAVAFHSQNLEVAQISEEAYLTLRALSRGQATPGFEDAAQALFAWESRINPETRSEAKSQGVRALTINVTQVCNLQCKYCAAGGDGTYGDPVKRIVVSETLPTLRNLLEKVPKDEIFRITFLGGEPLLYPEGIRILGSTAREWARELGIRVEFTVVTNGTLLTDANLELMAELHSDVTISLDGPAEVNDVRRPGKSGQGATAKVEEGLKRLSAYKSRLGNVMISGVFGRGNLGLLKVYDYYKSFDVTWFDFTFDHHETSSEINQEFMRQLQAVADQAYSEGGESALRRIHTFDRYFNSLDQQQRTENYCGAGKSFLMLDARQNLYTCPWVVGEKDEIVGHKTAMFEDKLAPYQETLLEKHGCGGCWARFMCGGGCMYIHRQATGNKHKVDQNFCERTRFLVETALIYYARSRAA